MVLNGFQADYSTIESGVPQGSVLGPLLFLIYINDLEKNIKSNVIFFADDTMLFSIVKDPVISANELNHDLNIINQQAYQWKMEFNPDPSKQATKILFSCKRNRPIHPSLFFNGTVVPKVNEQKHLGLILDSKLSVERHVNEKIIKAKKCIGIIRYLSKFLSLKTLDQMYKALVRSHLDYCNIIYHIPASNRQLNLGVTLSSLMEKVERIQYQAALAVTGTWQGSNRAKHYEELRWETSSDRRWCRRILQICKIKNNMTPTYLSDKLPPIRRLLSRLGNTNTFHEIRCKTSRYMNSFFPDAIISWNNIITNFQNLPPFISRMSHIQSLIRPKIKSTYGVHDPLGLHYLFQLRVRLSPLRNHKNTIILRTLLQRFVNTIKVLKIQAICLRAPPTQSEHHARHIASLTATVIEILQRNNLNHLGNLPELYLYGHQLRNRADNKTILFSTIKYIKDTQRFSV